MEEDGSRAGFIFGTIGGFFNIIVLCALIIKVVFIALDSLKSTEQPSYFSYFIFISLMIYFGILGAWIFASAFRMKYSFSMHKGAIFCLILGFLSVNIFAVFGGIFGLTDSRQDQKTAQAANLQPAKKQPQ